MISLKRTSWIIISMFPILFYMIFSSCGETVTPKSDLEIGKDLYATYCEFCHGTKGDGAIASMLKVVPPDLTLISQRRNGNFPDGEIYKIIDGQEDAKAGHGDRPMPIWGEIFAKAEGVDEVMVPKKIYQLIEYLKSIQK